MAIDDKSVKKATPANPPADVVASTAGFLDPAAVQVMRAAEEAKGNKSAFDPSALPTMIDGATGVMVYVHTGLAPVELGVDLPERRAFKGEIIGMIPSEAKMVAAKGHGKLLLPRAA